MANVVGNYVERTSGRLLRSLHRSGGSVPLHRIQFSNSIIQYLLDTKLAQVQNTGHGFLLEIAAIQPVRSTPTIGSEFLG